MAFGKSFVDQRLLIPEQHRDLIWFLFPSEVVGELLNLKKGQLTFESLQALS